MRKAILSVPMLAMLGVSAAADFEVKDEAEFKKMFPAGAKVERLATGLQFVEGPVWVYAKPSGYLVFSDIPANQLKRWDGKALATFREPSNNANGNSLDSQGRILTAEHSGRRISRTGAGGNVASVVDSFEGKKLNSPNDVVMKGDGTIWFTDPDYGLGGKPKEQAGNYVYRFHEKAKQLTAVVKDFDKPNGLCFSPDEKTLYVADSGKPRHIRSFAVNSDGTLGAGSVFANIDKGGPDGIRCDQAGRVWSSSGDGAQVFSSSGKLLARVLLPESAANLAFGGSDGHTLFLTARKSLYSVRTLVRDAKKGKRR